MEKDAVIASFRQFAPVSDADAEIVRARFSKVLAPARSFLMHAGEVSQHVYFVVKGCVRVAIETPDGEDVSCYFAAEGQFVSNYESFVSGKPSAYALHTLEPCELLAVDRQGLQEIYAMTSHGERIGRLLAEQLFIDALNRVTSFYLETPEQRYAKFVAAHPQLVARLPQHYIASHVGVRPQSLSRIKKRAMAGMHLGA